MTALRKKDLEKTFHLDSGCPTEPAKVTQKTIMTTINGQLELGLGTMRATTSAAVAPHRRVRAQWWFDRMRDVVNRAFDWQPAPAPRAEQIWLEGAPREPGRA